MDGSMVRAGPAVSLTAQRHTDADELMVAPRAPTIEGRLQSVDAVTCAVRGG